MLYVPNPGGGVVFFFCIYFFVVNRSVVVQPLCFRLTQSVWCVTPQTHSKLFYSSIRSLRSKETVPVPPLFFVLKKTKAYEWGRFLQIENNVSFTLSFLASLTDWLFIN